MYLVIKKLGSIKDKIIAIRDKKKMSKLIATLVSEELKEDEVYFSALREMEQILNRSPDSVDLETVQRLLDHLEKSYEDQDATTYLFVTSRLIGYAFSVILQKRPELFQKLTQEYLKQDKEEPEKEKEDSGKIKKYKDVKEYQDKEAFPEPDPDVFDPKMLPKWIQRVEKLFSSRQKRTKKEPERDQVLDLMTLPGLLPHVEQAFGSLEEDMRDLAIGTQSTLKAMILQEAFQDPNRRIPEIELKRIKNRVIPVLRIIERLTRNYPTLGIQILNQNFDPKDRGNLFRTLSQVALANFLRHTPGLHDEEIPYRSLRAYVRALEEKMNKYELKVIPTVYPIMILQLQQWEKLGLLEPIVYDVSLWGNHLSDSVFLFVTTLLLSLPTRFLKNIIDYYHQGDKKWWRQGAIAGLTEPHPIHPWTGKMDDANNPRSEGTKTFFGSILFAITPLLRHTTKDLTGLTQDMESGKKPQDARIRSFQRFVRRGIYDRGSHKFRYYPADLRNLFLLAVGAAYANGRFGLEPSPEIAQIYEKLKQIVIEELNKNLGSDVSTELFPAELSNADKDALYTGGLKQIFSKVTALYVDNYELHLHFQEKVERVLDELHDKLFPAELEGKIIQLVLDEQWDTVYHLLIENIISRGESKPCEDLRSRAFDLMEIGRYPEKERIREAFDKFRQNG